MPRMAAVIPPKPEPLERWKDGAQATPRPHTHARTWGHSSAPGQDIYHSPHYSDECAASVVERKKAECSATTNGKERARSPCPCARNEVLSIKSPA